MKFQSSAKFRHFVAFVSVAVAIGFCFFDGCVNLHYDPIVKSIDQKGMTPKEMQFIFDLCVTFFGSVYSVGQHLYRLFRRQNDADALESWSKWHMKILDLPASIALFWSVWNSWSEFHFIRPAGLIAGSMLLDTGIWVVGIIRRKKTSPIR